MRQLTEEFAQLYNGRKDAYGTGKGQWIHSEPTLDVYDQHLKGKGNGLGIAPLLDDGTVNFAAIDLDEPDFDAGKEMQEFLGFGTTWLEKSRSGNCHVLAFFKEPIEAWIVRGVMREATAAIGKPAVEIFPKQNSLLPGMVGNYINLAYFGDTRPVFRRERIRLMPEPKESEVYTLDEFVAVVLEKLNDPADWRKRADWLMIAPPEHRHNDQQEFGTGKQLHMCAEWIIANRDEIPIAEGHRNVVYFNLAKQLAHYEGFSSDEVWDMLCMVRDSSDAQGIDHVSNSELRRIFNNAERGGFTSTGCDDALMAPYVHPDCPIAKGR
jgi:hypothetical protein